MEIMLQVRVIALSSENGGPVQEEEYGFSQEDADVSKERDSLSEDDVEEGLEGRTGDATLVEDGWHGALMVRPMVGFSAWSTAGGPVKKDEDVFKELEGVDTFVGVTGRRWSSSTEMIEGEWAVRKSGGGVMLAKSRAMG